jgi:hypothetical protein
VKLKEVFERKKERNRNFTGNLEKSSYIYLLNEDSNQKILIIFLLCMKTNKTTNACRVAHLHSDLT